MARQKEVRTQLTGFAAYSRNSLTYTHKMRFGMSTTKKVLIVLAIVLVASLALCGVAVAGYINQINKNLRGSYTKEQTFAIQEKLVPTTDINDPFYIMLIGSDAREDDSSMGARSDSNILTRVDPTTWTVTMVSIPRDTQITYNGSTIKFNAVYSYGGAAGVIDAASQLCKVDINHYAEISFDGLEALVDSLGGVEVDVPQPIDDPQAGWATIDQAGVQTLNGAQALVFARSRHYYLDGDFSRSSNQRALIEAIVTKTLSLPVGQIPGKVQDMSKCVSTDFTINQLYSLAMQYINSGKKLTVYSAMAPSTTGSGADGASYVFVDPTDLANMMKLVEAGEDPNNVQLTSGSRISGNFEHYNYTEGYD